MPKLPTAKRAEIVSLLLKEMSLRDIARHTGVALNTVYKLVDDAGNACGFFHDRSVQNLRGNLYIQADELWAFIYIKAKRLHLAKSPPPGSGDVWTWLAMDQDSKLIISYHVSNSRDTEGASALMDDLSTRIEDRPQISTDGLAAYREAVWDAFGRKVDFTQIIKDFKKLEQNKKWKRKRKRKKPKKPPNLRKEVVIGSPDLEKASTSIIERLNSTFREESRRQSRKTRAHSKAFYRHLANTHLWVTHYNFCRVHSALKTTPAIAAGLDDTVRDFEWIVDLMDAVAPKPGPKPGTKYKPRKPKH